MGRAVLLAGAVICVIAAIAGALVSAFGVERLLAALPPLAIDADAVAGAVLAVSVALAIAAAMHAAVLVGMARGIRLAWTAGLLLSGLGVAVTIGLAGSALTSAAVEPELAVPLVAAGAACLVASFGYAAAAAWFIGEIRARSASGGGI